jgi:hypothetical protein
VSKSRDKVGDRESGKPLRETKEHLMTGESGSKFSGSKGFLCKGKSSSGISV